MHRHALATLLAYASSCASDLPPASPSAPTFEPATPVFGEVRCGMPWPEPLTDGAPLYVAQRPATLGGAPIEAMLLLACGGKVAGIAGERVFARAASDRSIVDDAPPVVVDDPVEAAIALATAVRDASLRQGFTQTGVLGGGLAEALAAGAAAPTPGRPPTPRADAGRRHGAAVGLDDGGVEARSQRVEAEVLDDGREGAQR